MKILVICKRQYTSRDLLDDQYGRLFEIPESLSQLGNEVRGLTISYRRKVEGIFKPKSVIWKTINCLPFLGTLKCHNAINQLIEEFKPDIVWASSDAFVIITTAKACKNHKTPFVIDFYDNYESFQLTKLPLVKYLLRNASRNAIGLTTVTKNLSNLIKQNYNIQSIPILEMGNAADVAHFFPINKNIARMRLGLPEDGLLIGTAGALDSSRGIETLFKAFELLEKKHSKLFLVVAGPRDKTVQKFKSKNIIDLGIMPPDMISFLFNSLDIAIICNKNSDFGAYCYPQKYEEIVACHVPVLAANVGELALRLAQTPNRLFIPESPYDLSQKIEFLLSETPLSDAYSPQISWQERAMTLNQFLLML